jgi:hypothetical protein
MARLRRKAYAMKVRLTTETTGTTATGTVNHIVLPKAETAALVNASEPNLKVAAIADDVEVAVAAAVPAAVAAAVAGSRLTCATRTGKR